MQWSNAGCENFYVVITDLPLHFLFILTQQPQWARASSFTRFLDHTQRSTTVGRTPLDEWLARRRDLLPDNTQSSQLTDIHVPGRIRTHNPSKRAAANTRLRPRGHWDRPPPSLLSSPFLDSTAATVDYSTPSLSKIREITSDIFKKFLFFISW